jgi:hypothetical protein
MRAKLWLAAVLACAPALAAPPSGEDLESRRRMLDFGLWNNRVNALYDAGELGLDGLPLLIYASDDADWQIRLTAAHFMGKLGPAAAPALGALAGAEPCLNVRVSALRWLSGMGSEGKAILKDVMSPEDEREMLDQPDRFGTERMGKPLVIDPPGGSMTPEFFDHGLDLRACASSEYANRRRRSGELIHPAPRARREIAAAPAAAPARYDEDPGPSTFEPVRTPPVGRAKPAPRAPERLPDAPPPAHVALIEPEAPLPRPRRRGKPDAELADSRTPGAPETLPPSGPGLAPRESPEASASFAPAPGPRPAAAEAPPRAALPPPEVMPPGPEGINHPAVERGEAALVDDAGTGKPENDPIPELIRRLSSAEPRTRARAADELGKRGPAARIAAPALRRALADRDRRVRASAVLALGGVAGSVDGVVGDLRRALRDKNEDVRFSAVIALQRLEARPKTK